MLNTIGRKLGLGFGVVLALMAGSAIVAYVKLDNLVNEAIPLDVNCTRLHDEVQRSLAALPSYVILGGENFRVRHIDARMEIDAALAELEALSRPAMNAEDRLTLERVKDGVAALTQAQDGLVPVASGTTGQADDVVLHVRRMQQALTRMIDEESALEATPQRKRLLNALANSRGSLAIGVGNIRTYLLSGDEQFTADFDNDWRQNRQAQSALAAMESFMTEAQRSEWDSYQRERANFELLRDQLFALRTTADDITTHLGTLRASAAQQRGTARKAVTVTLAAATFVAIALGSLIALVLSRSISTRVTALAERADAIASGNLEGEALTIGADDELGHLAMSFNTMAGNLREMIGRMTSQEKMLASEARAKAIFGAAADGLVTIDEGGVIHSANPAAEKLFGYTNQELVGSNVRVLAPSPHHEQHQSYLERYLATGDARIIGRGRELQAVRKDGSCFDILLRVVELKLDEERIFIGTISDITEAKRTQLAIHEAVNRLSEAMAEILATTTQQAAGTEEQAAAVTQTVTTVDELRQIAEQAAERAQQMSSAAQRTGEVGDAGRQAVEDSIAAMSEVKSQVESLAENILSLAERAQTIGEITATVNDIAEQTNVLALNAAVEAARAGDHGKGFAVVASEVKSLAEQSKKATAQVRGILGEIQQATNAAVLSTEHGTRAVSGASEVVTQAGETINTLSQTISDLARTANQISAAANQQATGVTQLNQSIRNIEKVTKENVLSIRQIEQSTQNLNLLSTELAGLTA